MLYSRNAKVYAACRSEEKALRIIEDIKKKAGSKSTGEITFLHLNLADLASVKSCAAVFLARESKLHVLFNNAGVMTGPATPAPRTAQGHELAPGVNCIGAFLLTKLLTPTLVATARTEPPNTVRVVWPSLFGLLQFSPEDRGIDMSNLDYHIPKPGIDRYGISKCGTWLLGVEYARRYKVDGVVSIAISPGNVLTELARDAALWLKLIGHAVVYKYVTSPCPRNASSILTWCRLDYRVMFGVYTQLYAAFSPDVAIYKADWTNEWGE